MTNHALGIKLRQSHRDLAKSAFLMHGRYMKANQFRRIAGERRKLKIYAGRVQRDLERKLSDDVWEQHKGTMILADLVIDAGEGAMWIEGKRATVWNRRPAG